MQTLSWADVVAGSPSGSPVKDSMSYEKPIARDNSTSLVMNTTPVQLDKNKLPAAKISPVLGPEKKKEGAKNAKFSTVQGETKTCLKKKYNNTKKPAQFTESSRTAAGSSQDRSDSGALTSAPTRFKNSGKHKKSSNKATAGSKVETFRTDTENAQAISNSATSSGTSKFPKGVDKKKNTGSRSIANSVQSSTGSVLPSTTHNFSKTGGRNKNNKKKITSFSVTNTDDTSVNSVASGSTSSGTGRGVNRKRKPNSGSLASKGSISNEDTTQKNKNSVRGSTPVATGAPTATHMKNKNYTSKSTAKHESSSILLELTAKGCISDATSSAVTTADSSTAFQQQQEQQERAIGKDSKKPQQQSITNETGNTHKKKEEVTSGQAPLISGVSLDITDASSSTSSMANALQFMKATLASSTAPLVATNFLQAPKVEVSPRKRSPSAKTYAEVKKNDTSPAYLTVARTPLKLRSWKDCQKAVEGLQLPGILYDKYGVCIALDAPEWVRGRIARQVQILVDDFEAGGNVMHFDINAELEMEKKEKAYFDDNTWDALFKIDSRDPVADDAKPALMNILQDFSKDLAAERIGAEPKAVGKGEPETKVADGAMEREQSFCQLPVPHNGAQNVYGDNNMAQQLPPAGYFEQPTSLTSAEQEPLPQQILTQQGLAPQTPFDQMVYDQFSAQQFTPYAPTQWQHNLDPREHPRYRKAICHNFLQGYCYYGDTCHFLHAYPHQLEASTAAGQDRPDLTQNFKYSHHGHWRKSPDKAFAKRGGNHYHGNRAPSVTAGPSEASIPRPRSVFSNKCFKIVQPRSRASTKTETRNQSFTKSSNREVEHTEPFPPLFPMPTSTHMDTEGDGVCSNGVPQNDEPRSHIIPSTKSSSQIPVKPVSDAVKQSQHLPHKFANTKLNGQGPDSTSKNVFKRPQVSPHKSASTNASIQGWGRLSNKRFNHTESFSHTSMRARDEAQTNVQGSTQTEAQMGTETVTRAGIQAGSHSNAQETCKEVQSPISQAFLQIDNRVRVGYQGAFNNAPWFNGKKKPWKQKPEMQKRHNAGSPYQTKEVN